MSYNETPTERRLVMSAETAAEKKSILTRAMEAAEAKKAERIANSESTDQVAAYEKKQLLKAVGVVAAICVSTVVAVAVYKNRTEDETSSDEATSED